MRSKVEIIEDMIARVERRIERIEEMYDAGEINGEHADIATQKAFEELSELEIELEEQRRRDEQDRLDRLPPLQIDIDRW